MRRRSADPTLRVAADATAAPDPFGPVEDRHLERGLTLTYLALRALFCLEGSICVISGWRTYRRPGLAALTLGGCMAESVWVARRCWRSGTCEPPVARVETITGIAGLLTLALATDPADRTTPLNWMLPYTVSSSVGLSSAFGISAEGAATLTSLGGTYLASVLPAQPRGSATRTTALVNAASYLGFYGAALTVVAVARRANQALADARSEAETRGAELIEARHRAEASREQRRQHRLIHDSALQTLEVVAAGLHSDTSDVRAQARADAERLRRMLDGDAGATSLRDGIRQLVAEMESLGLSCEAAVACSSEPPAETTSALLDAAREALRNVVKHAGVTVAALQVSDRKGGVELVVQDEGAGFDPRDDAAGFGLQHSVRGRLADVRGTVELLSAPRAGTRVTLWAPHAAAQSDDDGPRSFEPAPRVASPEPTVGFAPGPGEATGLDRSLLGVFLAARFVHLCQGLFCTINGRSTYRRPRLAAAALAAAAVESAWVVKRCWATGTCDAVTARVDATTSAAGLLAMARATEPANRTTSMNWMLPYSVGSVPGVALALGMQPEGIAITSGLATTYLATTFSTRDATQRTSALANTASYGGLYVVAHIVARTTRQARSVLARARREAAESGRQLIEERLRLASERARRDQARVIEDSALRTLEQVADGLQTHPDGIRAMATAQAARLRRVLAGADTGSALGTGMQRLVDRFGEVGLDCTYTASIRSEPSLATVGALLVATRSALERAAASAGVGRVVIRAIDLKDGVQVTIRDHATAPDPNASSQSLPAALDDVGGQVDVWSEPGRGTRVTLWAPI